MSSLFGNLPPESAHKHTRKAEGEEEIPPNKRLKTELVAPAEALVKSAPFAGQDPVATALIKISAYISSSKKFAKASELLRQLIIEHKIGEEHTKLVFEVAIWYYIYRFYLGKLLSRAHYCHQQALA